MTETDDTHIRDVVRSYVEGMVGADEGMLRQAFHPSASIIGNYHGAVEWLSIDGFLGEILSVGVSEAEAWRVASLDMTDDAAVAKVSCTYAESRLTDDRDDGAVAPTTPTYAGSRFTDYLSLLKIEGQWKIVAKLYRLHD